MIGWILSRAILFRILRCCFKMGERSCGAEELEKKLERSREEEPRWVLE
jgi:hypothetical protein